MSDQVAEQLVIELPEELAVGVAPALTPPTAPPEERLGEWGAPASAPSAPELTHDQELAVERRSGSVLLAAGAGSGKTAVLVERFARAVLADGIAPAKILAITFTERAAGELAQRLRQRFLDAGRREHARDVEAAIVGTFHTFCARLLRLHALAAEVPPDFHVLDESQAARMRFDAFRVALADVVAQDRDRAVELLAAYGTARLRETVLGIHAELRSRGEREPRLLSARDDDERASDALAVLADLLATFGTRYEALKRARGALDFDDLELRARGVLEQHPQIRSSWRERFELLMVDELQDSNHRQLALLRLLERENLFTVGDELQSIYAFRHADVELFRRRRDELSRSGAALELRENFRSRAQVLRAVNAIFAPRFGDRYSPLIAARTDERAGEEAEPAVELLLTDREWGREEEVCGAAAEPEVPGWRRAEAHMLAQRIADLIADGEVRARDVAVLLRASTGLDSYARALEEHGVATLAAVGGFWADRSIGDLLAYLRALANPRDELALHGALASALAGLSRDALALIARAGRNGGGAWGAARALARDESEVNALAAADRDRLRAFCELLERERTQCAWRGVAGALRHVIEESGYEARLLAGPAPERRIANVRKLVRLAERYEREEGADLRGFLDYAAHAEETLARMEPHAPVADEELDAVRIMTIHAAKGLEFPVVCVPELGARPNVRVPDLLVDRDRVGLRLLRLGVTEATPAFDFAELSAERRGAQEQEEDRILYVALTRARERLLLSGVVGFRRWPSAREGCAPIAWVGPSIVPGVEQRLHALHDGGGDREGADGATSPAEPVWVADGPAGRVRCWLNGPPTLGRVLREGALRPLARAAGGGAAGTVVEDGASRASARRTPSEPGGGGSPAIGARRTHEHAADRLPSALSYTALSKLARCGYRYYLEDVLRLPEATEGTPGAHRGGSGARARGEVLHRLLERLDFADEPAVPDATAVASVARELGTPLGANECEEMASLLRALPGTALARRLAASGVRREQPFAFVVAHAQPIVTGVIDALLRDGEQHTLVVDYKSDRVEAGEDLDALVRERYGLQRLIYALAALREGAREVEVVHWFLERPDEPASACFHAADAAALEGDLERSLGELASRTYAVSAHPSRELCSGCPGRGTLCSWSAEETLAAPG